MSDAQELSPPDLPARERKRLPVYFKVPLPIAEKKLTEQRRSGMEWDEWNKLTERKSSEGVVACVQSILSGKGTFRFRCGAKGGMEASGKGPLHHVHISPKGHLTFPDHNTTSDILLSLGQSSGAVTCTQLIQTIRKATEPDPDTDTIAREEWRRRRYYARNGTDIRTQKLMALFGESTESGLPDWVRAYIWLEKRRTEGRIELSRELAKLSSVDSYKTDASLRIIEAEPSIQSVDWVEPEYWDGSHIRTAIHRAGGEYRLVGKAEVILPWPDGLNSFERGALVVNHDGHEDVAPFTAPFPHDERKLMAHVTCQQKRTILTVLLERGKGKRWNVVEFDPFKVG